MVPRIDSLSDARLPLVCTSSTPDVERPRPCNGHADQRPEDFPDPSSEAGQSQSERGQHVLVVDDRDDVRQVLLEVLAEAGYRTSSADGGKAVRALLDQHRPDMILLDAVLPGENGLSLARYAGTLGIPVIMMSGHPEVLVQLEKGDLPFIAKPFRIVDLVTAIRVVQKESRAAKNGAPLPGDEVRVRRTGRRKWATGPTAKRHQMWQRFTAPTLRRITARRMRTSGRWG